MEHRRAEPLNGSIIATEPADDPASSAMPAGALAEATPADDPASADMPMPAGAEALRSFAERGFAVCPGVFQPEEMVTFGARISELAVQEVADIVASGVNLQPGTLDWSSAEDYAEWQRSNPDWQKTIVAMSKVQVMPDGEIIARKLNTPINDYPHEPFRRFALDPRMTALASEFLGGRQALLYSDQVFIKPP